MEIGNIVIICMAVMFQDVYCCYSETTLGRRECCNDRTKSLYNADMTYWNEAFIMSYPFLVLFGGCVTLVIVYTSMQPKEAEVKHEIYE
ncbi:hypothetical protein MAR_024083 [Mya arenaria]|uniref:Uncharacterized protein n=1 Tax=Mya arenaria TaxID=6604 RepID=A0ABY7DXP9_MYAAR|nr:hypothetical protein MAR_024083 [Mya arenaria]